MDEILDILEQLEKYELEKDTRKVYKLSSELENRRLNLLLLQEILKELREIKGLLKVQVGGKTASQ